MTYRAYLLTWLLTLVSAEQSSTATRTVTHTSTPTVVTPSQTASASTFPLLSLEQWGVYDVSPTSLDPTVLLPVFLMRSQIDNQLYLEFVNFVDPASNPPQSAWGRAADGRRSHMRGRRKCAEVASMHAACRCADAVDVYNAWFDSGEPYSNVATQGTRNPAGDNLCVKEALPRIALPRMCADASSSPPPSRSERRPNKDVVTYWK